MIEKDFSIAILSTADFIGSFYIIEYYCDKIISIDHFSCCYKVNQNRFNV